MIMKKILILALICCFTLGCKDKYTIEREKKEQAFKQMRDSLSNTDVQLSFMDIKIGGPVNLIDSAIAKGKIQIDSCKNGIYIGSVSVPIVRVNLHGENEKFNSSAIMRIGTFKDQVASIELFFECLNPSYTSDTFDFFVDTFCERYYDQEEEKLDCTTFPDFDHYEWDFKNQSLSVEKNTHKEVGYGSLGTIGEDGKNEYGVREYDALDGITVTYHHKGLNDVLMKKINQQIVDSIQVAQKEAEAKNNRQRIEAEKNKSEFKKNI